MSHASARLVARRSWLRPLPWIVGACLLSHWPREDAFHHLQQEGLELSELQWLDPRPQGAAALWTRPRVLAVAARPGEPTDVYLGFGYFSPGGELLEVSPLRNLTETRGLAEHAVQVRGRRAGWLLSSPDGVAGATVATFERSWTPAEATTCGVLERAGCPMAEQQADWTRVQRWQHRLENWQELGSPLQLERQTVQVEPPVQRLRLTLDDGGGHLLLDGELFMSPAAPESGGDLPAGATGWETETTGRPGNVTTWLAERLRETPLGEGGVSLLKAVGFAGRDYARRAATALFEDTTTADATADLGDLLRRPASSQRAGRNVPGWPPPPITPLLERVAPDEGVWLSLDDDPFVAQTPEGHAPFLFTFVRPDAKRPHVRVHVVLWDPRRVELHAVGGTTEPRSERGERGSGRIPREPQVLERLAGAFNGGFRTRHGEFGMAADDTLYIPPKPYGATVATLDDGSTAMGTWPDAPGLPSSILSFRQNMTPLLQDGQPNPYRRHWWGGTPEGWQHESFTVRTALCLTREGFLAYLYGDFLDPGSLIAAGKALRCDYAMHLDMNAGHTGFELYRAAPAGILSVPDALDRSWQAHGQVPDALGYEFVARRMTKHMPLMNFPRYIHREQRDFFYLTLRPSVGQRRLPRAWRPSGPHGGWELGDAGPGGAPSPWAHASARPFASEPELGVHLLALDPRRVHPHLEGAPPGITDHSPVTADRRNPIRPPGNAGAAARRFATIESPASLAADANPSTPNGHAVSPTHVWWEANGFSLARSAPPTASLVAQVLPAEPQHAAAALVGIDADGFLVYAEVEGSTRVLAKELLALAGPLALEPALALGERLHWSFDVGPAAPDGVSDAPLPANRHASHTTRRGPGRLRTTLWAVAGPGATRLFPETPVVEPGVWAYRQLTHLPVTTSSAASPRGAAPQAR